MNDSVEVPKKDLQLLLETYFSTTDLFHDVVDMYDNGEMGKACQHIGAELEAGVRNIHEIEENNPEIKKLIDKLHSEYGQTTDSELEQMEKDLLGDLIDEDEL